MKNLLQLVRLGALAALVVACGVEEEGDDCADEACTSPPAALCDGDSLLRYADVGECVSDECSYELSRVACVGGCADGACVGGEGSADGSGMGSGDGMADGSGEGSAS